MPIGLKRGTVSVREHQTEWEYSAREMIKILKETAKNDIIDAQHIGSTAVKTVCAKPIIDIVAGVNDFNNMFKHNDELMKKGIVYRREDHPEQHLYVCEDKAANIQTHYIHVVIYNQKNWNNYINMRDYLNANTPAAAEYSELKKRLAEKYPNDRIAYTNGKSELIQKILKLAEMQNNS